MPGVPGRAGVGLGCRFQEGVHGAFQGVFAEKVFLCAPSVVVPFLLLSPLEGRVVRWGVTLDGLVVLLAVHGGYGTGECGVDVLWGGGGGAWRCSRAPFAGVRRSGLRWTRGIWSVVAWCGQAPAVPWVAGGLVGEGPSLPVGVGWPGGRRSLRPSSGLQRTSCRGKRGGGLAAVLRR